MTLVAYIIKKRRFECSIVDNYIMKDEVMTNIVSLLESDETFAEIVEKIL